MYVLYNVYFEEAYQNVLFVFKVHFNLYKT